MCIHDTEAEKRKLKHALLAMKDAMLELDRAKTAEIGSTKTRAKVVDKWK